MLCSLYYSVFQHFCTITNSSFFDITKLTKEFDQIREEFSNKPTEVCNSLKLINSTILLKPDLVKVFNKNSSCFHLCTDYEDKVVDVCSLTSFIWNLTVDYTAKDRRVDPKGEIAISSGKKNTMLPKVSNGIVQSKTNMSNGNVNIDANKLENTDGVQQSTSDNSLVIQDSPNVPGQVSTPNATNVKVITAQGNKEVPNLKKDKSTPQQNDEVQVGEVQPVPDEKQSISKAKPISNTVDNKPEATNTLNINNDAKKIKTNEIHAKNDEIKSNGTDLEVKPSTDTQIKENAETESIKNKPIVLQSEKEAKKQDDNPEDTKPDDTAIYMDKEDDDDENDFLPPKKITKVNEDKPEDNGDELQLLPKSSEVKTKIEVAKPKEIDEDTAANYKNQNIDDSDSYFFSYFMMVCVVFICGYVAYHNKQKILALVLEGRKGRRPSRTRRPNSSNYRKLDSTLEEAVTSSCNKNSTQVIY
ncbi:hypothetical protein RI129_001414 [Pyrocoelia pectoralis]|uniref:Trans-Golgi network integral membrane protein 2 n=1 Tax=Pyrocoelia pectoralis TaxID=417401 RepID=A0AAN7VMX5_9COLE